MSDARIDTPLPNLWQAFAALEKSEVKSPHGDVGRCLTLIRLRDLATDARLTRSADARHLKRCRKCSVRLSAMQSELGTDAATRFNSALENDRRNLSRFATAERLARELFDRLHAHRGAPDQEFDWSEIHATVQVLRGHHGPGEEEDAESVIVMTSTAIRSALADASTPFARSLDAAWPVVLMLATTGIEAARHSDRISNRFAYEYAGIVQSAPAPLRAALTYGLGKFLRRNPPLERIASGVVMHLVRYDDPEIHSILTMLSQTEAPQLKLVVRTDRTQADPRLASINASLSELAERVRMQGDLSDIVSTVQITTSEMLARILEDGDAMSKLLQLLLTRHYLASAAKQINDRWPHTLDRFDYMGGIGSAVMRNAQHADHQYFVATEVVSAIGRNPSAIGFMADLLEIPNPSLRQALFVYLHELADRSPAIPFRFVGEGSNWVFEGGASAPTAIFGNRAAALAKEDPEIAALIEWSQLHRVAHTKSVGKQPVRV